MGAMLQSISDPRDSLDKATRDELLDFAKENGVELPDGEQTKKTDLVPKLRALGLNNIKIPNRQLADPRGFVPSQPKPREDVSVVEPVAPTPKQEQQPVTLEDMNIQQLRKECKRLGIKQLPSDGKRELREKLGNG